MKSWLNHNMKERERWVDIAKGIGILTVMYVHAGGIIGRNFIAPYYIQMFFFLSGYIFYKNGSYENAIRNAKTISQKFVKYAIINYCLFIPAAIILKKPPFFYIRNAFGILYGRGMLYYPAESEPQISFMQVGNGPMWYLTCLTMVWIIKAIELKVCRNKNNKICWNILLIVTTVVLKNIPIMLPWGIDVAFGMILFLNLGMFFKWITEKNGIFKLLVITLSGLGLLYLVLISKVNVELNISTRYYGVYNSFLFVLLLGIIGIPLVILASRFLESVVKRSILEFFGRYSIFLLAFHSLIYKYIDIIESSIECYIGYYVNVFIKIIVALIICLIIANISNKRRVAVKNKA